MQKFVKECDTCQRNKSENCLPQGLLQPLPIPEQAWEDISLDFVEGLPKSQGRNTILVIIGRFTKYGHFVALTHPISSSYLVEVFMDNIYKLHGLPKTIVSDSDRVFISQF